MATIKSFTSLQQSKKLAEILPLESADMWWSRCTITDFGDGVLKVSYAVEPCNISQFRNTREDVPCWSLAALLNVIPEVSLNTFKDGKWNAMVQHDGKMIYEDKETSVDACYEMILKLHELKIL